MTHNFLSIFAIFKRSLEHIQVANWDLLVTVVNVMRAIKRDQAKKNRFNPFCLN